MDTTQLGVIVTAIVAAGTGIAAAIKWSATRIVRALDANTAAFVAAEKAAAAQTEALRNLAAEVRYVHEWCDEHTGVTDAASIARRPEPRRSGAAAGQYSLVRKRTEGEG
jgi:hypothetical protein